MKVWYFDLQQTDYVYMKLTQFMKIWTGHIVELVWDNGLSSGHDKWLS